MTRVFFKPLFIACGLLFSQTAIANDNPHLSFRDIPIVEKQTSNGLPNTAKLLEHLKVQSVSHIEFKAVSAQTIKAPTGGLSHQTFDQFYQGYPVWGQQIALHTNKQGEVVKLNGQLVTGINNSLYVEGSHQAKFQNDDALTKTIATLMTRFDGADIAISDKQAKAFVYLCQDAHHLGADPQAKLVYHLSFYYQHNNRRYAPNALVDANSLEILKTWDGVLHQNATGPGGNEKTGRYVYGEDKDALQVSRSGNVCALENDYVKTKATFGDGYVASAYEFICPNNEGVTENGAYSPLNDAHFHGTKAAQMFKQWLDIDGPEGGFSIEVHSGDVVNSVYENVITVGNGDAQSYPGSTLNTIGHEVGHLMLTPITFYTHYSSLGQSGAISESFADITGEALEYFITGEVDWLVDAHVSKSDKPLRYFAEPRLDGQSIGHAGSYTSYLGTHEVAGVFNRAFYLLANTTGWTVKEAFMVFADARRFYWVGDYSFEQGACGVIQAADDRGLNTLDVDSAFVNVGVECTNLPQVDSDGDAMSDVWEARYQLNPNSKADGSQDKDNDGLLNYQEHAAGSSPVNSDSDGDFLSDYDEVIVYQSKVMSWDSISSFIEDGLLVANGLEPKSGVNSYTDTDSDGYTDFNEILVGSNRKKFNDIPEAINIGSQSFEQPVGESSGWHIDVLNEADNRHLWSYQSGGAVDGEQFIRATIDAKDGQSELSWFGHFQAGYLVFDYAYQGEGINLQVDVGENQTIDLFAQKHPDRWNRHVIAVEDGFTAIKWIVKATNDNQQFSLDNVRFFALGIDQDGDGMEDYWEHRHYLDVNDANDGQTDSDNDGLTNAQEAQLGTDPHRVDTDNDGYSDYAEVNLHHTDPTTGDTDGDGMDDVWELQFGLDVNTNDANKDFDGDGYSNFMEYKLGTIPNDVDSYSQGIETFNADFETDVPTKFSLG